MKRLMIITSCLVLIGLAIAIISLVSCNNQAKGANKFYYYPKLNAYYDVEYNYFLYTVDGGKTWREKPALNRKQAEKLGDHIILKNQQKEIWRDNQLHRQQYQGVVYNFEDPDKKTRHSRKPRSGVKTGKVYRRQPDSQPAANDIVAKTKQGKVEEVSLEEWDKPAIEVKVKDDNIQEYIGQTAEELRQRIERKRQQQAPADDN